jgi:polyhydroxyalkanoate synthesis repressor PhaR
MARKTADDGVVVIKKYANRRLYNTATSSYVTLDHLCQMVKEDVEFVVYDAKSGEDITRQVLTQIIVEEESKGENLLPISFLRQLISFYGHGMGWMLPSYLEQMMQSFTGNQEALAKAMGSLGDPGAAARVGLVSISTTLATNAVVEGHGSPIAVLLIGFDAAMAERIETSLASTPTPQAVEGRFQAGLRTREA